MACNIKFKNEHENNDTVSLNEKMLYATVYDKDGNISKLWEDVKKLPFVKDLSAAKDVMLNYFNKDFSNDFVKYEGTSEPKIFFKSTKGNVFETYKEALVNSEDGFVRVGFLNYKNYSGNLNEVKSLTDDNFYKVYSINSNKDASTIEGFINNYIANDLLSGTQVQDMQGNSMYVPEGKNETRRTFNGELVRSRAILNFDKQQVTKDSGGNIRIEEKQPLPSGVQNENGEIETLEKTINDVLEKGFQQLVDKTSEQQAVDVVTSDYVQSGDFEKFFNGFPLLQKENVKELRDKLFSILNRSGVQLISIEEYKKNYELKYGVEPDARALADLSRGIIALSENATIEDLSEEVSHFLVDTIDDVTLSNILNDLYLTESREYQTQSQKYREIYSKQNLTEEQLEKKVRKEVLGKLLSQGILKNYNTTKNEQERGFIGKVINAINKIIDRIKFHFSNPKIQIEIQDVVEKLSNEVLNDELTKFDVNKISQNYVEISGVYYSSAKTKSEIVALQRAIDNLEKRLKLAKEANIKDLNQFQNNIKKAAESLKNGNIQLSYKLVISEAESLTNKVKKSLEAYEKNGNEGNLQGIKYDHEVLRDHIIPSLEELRNHIDEIPEGEGFREADKIRLREQIKESISQQSENNSKYKRLTDISYEKAAKEIAIKYGVPESYLPMVVAALSKKQEDINTLYRWFGNPEHSQSPYLGLLAKILDSDRIKKVSIITPIAKKLEKFMTDNNWTFSDYDSVTEKDESGKSTHNLFSYIKEHQAIKAHQEFETDLYNEIKFGEDKSKYVSVEEYKQMHRLNKNGERTEPLEVIDETNLEDYHKFQKEVADWKEQNMEMQYHVDVYRERQATYRALGLSNQTILFLNSISSDRAAVFAQLVDGDGNLDPSVLEKNQHLIDELNSIHSRLKEAASPFDVHTEETYFKVNNEVTEDIIVSYTKDGETNPTTNTITIPTIEFIGHYEKYNDKDILNREAPYEVKLAYDITRRNLFNADKYGKDKRTINEKYYSEIDSIENYYAKQAGFGSYNELKTRGGKKEINDVVTSINKSLRNFLEVSGGLSFNEDFYNELSSRSSGLSRMEKLDNLINDEEVSEDVRNKAVDTKRLLTQRGDIFKKYKSKFNPAEIDVSLISKPILEKIKNLDKDIDANFSSLRDSLPKDKAEEITEPIASFELNESFENDLFESKMNKIDFMLLHTKDSHDYKYIKEDLRNLVKNGVGKKYSKFLGSKGYISKDGGVVNADFINTIKTEAGLEQIAADFLSVRMYSYYKRFTPIGYGAWLNNLNNGQYLVNGENTSFGEFLRNMSKKQNGETYQLNDKVEEYFKINPALQYTDGDTASFKEQMNPLYDRNFKDGRIQWKLDKWGNQEFFDRFGINAEAFKNNVESREEMLQEASKNHKHLEFILNIRDMNRIALDLYGESRNFSAFRIGRRRMGASESVRNLNKPVDRVRAWYNEVFTKDVDTMEYGAMDEHGQAIENSGLKGLRIIPKLGLYDLADMADNSSDIYHNTLYMLQGAVNYSVKKESLEDVLKLESGVEQADFMNGKKGSDTRTYEMFQEFVDAQYFGIQRNQKWEVNLFGRKVDLTRSISAIDRYVRKVNTAWNVAVSVTGLTSSSMFGLTEALTKEHMSSGAYSFGIAEVSKDFGSYVKEVGQMDRNSKSYLTARLLGVQDFDALHNAAASGRSVAERMMKNPGHKVTEIFTNHTGVQVAYAMLFDTRFYNGKWFSYNEFRNHELINGLSKKEIDSKWKSLKDNALYYNYDFNETNDTIKVSEKGNEMIRNYYKEVFEKQGEEYTADEINNLIEKKIGEVNKNIFPAVAGRVGSLHSFLEGRVLEEHKSSATRNAFLNPLLAHRGWFTNTLQRKFKTGHYNFVTGQYEIGSMTAALKTNPIGRLISVYKSKEATKEYGKEMMDTLLNPKLTTKQQELYDVIKENDGEEEADKVAKIMLNANQLQARRVGIETVILGALLMFGTLIAGYVDDPDRKDDFATQYLGYLYFRLASEYGSSNILTGLPQAVDMANRPAIMFNLFKEIVNEDNYSLEPVKSGPYKGMPKITKAIIKQTSARQFYDFIDMDKKSQSYRHFNSASLGGMYGFGLDKKSEE